MCWELVGQGDGQYQEVVGIIRWEEGLGRWQWQEGICGRALSVLSSFSLRPDCIEER